MEIISQARSFNGTQRVYRHNSKTLNCSMNFGIYLPDNLKTRIPALFWLSGLTCTEDNFITKGTAQRVASELGIIIVAPDTSPRGDGVPAGKYNRAVLVAQKALEVAEENVGPDHPSVATSLENLAALYRATNRITKAEEFDRRAAKIR